MPGKMCDPAESPRNLNTRLSRRTSPAPALDHPLALGGAAFQKPALTGVDGGEEEEPYANDGLSSSSVFISSHSFIGKNRTGRAGGRADRGGAQSFFRAPVLYTSN